MNAKFLLYSATIGASLTMALLSTPAHAGIEKNAAAAARSTPRRARAKSQVTAALTILGAVGKPQRWTNAQLQSEFAGQIKEIDYTLKGTPHKARCLPLLTLLEAVQPRYDTKIKRHNLAFVIALRSGDGYTVTLSMGELLPDYGNKEAWLALDQDGQPLPGNEAPVRLILPGDAKPSRWIQGVSSVTVFDGLKLLRTRGKPVQDSPTPTSFF